MAETHGPHLRRTWPQRVLIAFNLALIVVCLTGAGGLGYLYWKVGQLPRLSFSEGILAPERPPGEPQNFLLVGSDSRAFVEAGSAEEDSFGNQSLTGDRARADTIILLRVDPVTQQAAMVSFPRDLWLPIAGKESRNRINTAFENGAEQLIETITRNFNIPIHHYAQVDFKGFQGLVNAVGGVEIYLASQARDSVTGLNIAQTGCVELTGDQALAYVRSRHYQYLEDGRWRTDPTGDLGRIKRQQDFIRRAIREALSRDLLNPNRLNRILDVGVDNVKISNSLDLDDLRDLGRNFRSLAPDTLQQFQLPVTSVSRNGASVVVVLEENESEAEAIYDIFRGVTHETVAVAPSGVSVRVLNGSGRRGEAGDTSSALQQLQFSVDVPGDARTVQRSVIRYGSGQEAKARLLESYLKSGADIEAQAGLEGVDVVLITGADFAGVLAEPRLPAPEPTTTTSTEVPADELAAPEC